MRELQMDGAREGLERVIRIQDDEGLAGNSSGWYVDPGPVVALPASAELLITSAIDLTGSFT